MSNAANTSTSTSTGEPVKKRLTTSAMIASIASEGQATRSAPFGHAHLIETIRVGLGKNVQVGVLGEVSGEADDVRTLIRQCSQCMAKRC